MGLPFNASETMKKAEQEYGFGKGEYFKVQEGVNKLRLLSPCVGHQGEYQGKPNFKFVAWVLDRRDGKIKPYFMPPTILDGIGALQMSEDYGFEEVPMPYDINIQAKNAGKLEVEYNVIPSPHRAPLTPEEQAELDKKIPIDEFVEKLKEKSGVSVEQSAQPQSGYDKFQAAAEKLPHRPAPAQAVEDVPW